MNAEIQMSYSQRFSMLALVFVAAIGTTTFAATAACQGQDDLTVADFEGPDYESWTAVGDAFGTKPVHGTLAGQMTVSGYQGNGLVNSFRGGDRSVGTLTSPAFVAERRFLNFVIGGGGFHGATCVNLLVDGDIVDSAVGPNTEPGGSEALVPCAFDLSELHGHSLAIQIVDQRTGGWGHINADQFVQSDIRVAGAVKLGPVTRSMACEARYLLLPIQTGARRASIDVRIGSSAGASAGAEVVREFSAELASDVADVDFWAFMDLDGHSGEELELVVSGASEGGVALIRQSDDIPTGAANYDEALRPQLRFSQLVGWINDPNGMAYLDGEWHLYFQHNPYGWEWGNMHWGHAVSRDLLHWEQQPIAIYNRARGDWAYSGGGFIDHNNTAGWQVGDQKVLVAAWTRSVSRIDGCARRIQLFATRS